ncbi:hypothetical protein MNV49_002111 [Pseudohyphozyma bogoriensis]|nr:hypothetical protein MNV49_002111 [Pseudohyphozyma bogoriensis]
MNITNYSYYSIPVVYMLGVSSTPSSPQPRVLILTPLPTGAQIVPHWYAIYLTHTSKDLPPFEALHPREYIVKARSLEKQTPTVAKYLRAEAASANGFESLPVYCAAVVAGNVSGLGAGVLNKLALAYVISRVAYNYIYIRVTKENVSPLRSLAFNISAGICWTLFIKSGNAVNRR